MDNDFDVLKPEHVSASARAHVDNSPLDIKGFGEWLKALREERNLTLAALGELTGYSTSHLSQVETGKKKYLPAPEYLEKLSQPLGVSYADMLQLAGYEDLAKGVRLREVEEIFGEESFEAPSEREKTISEIIDLERFLSRDSAPFPVYNGHRLGKQERQQILDMLKVLFPQYRDRK